MNECLAILVYAFFQEVERTEQIYNSCDENEEDILSSDETFIEFFFSEGHTFADIYWSFDRVMQLGIKYLY